MTALRVVLVSPAALPAGSAALRLAGLAGAPAPLEARDLSAAYGLIERSLPDLVLVDGTLTAEPGFDGLLALIRLIGAAWLCLGPGVTDAPFLPGSGSHSDAALQAVLRTALDLRPAALPRAGQPPQPARRSPAQRLVLIGASTGGIEALLQILARFPPDCPPTAIVQHTGPAFSDSLLRLLSRSTAAEVTPARSGLALQAGRVILAAGSPGHLTLRTGRPVLAEVAPGPALSGHVPSIDRLFQSALGLGPRVAAALLTGMGRDGADGLLALRQAGALTIAQDQASSVIFGMPRAARDLGAACAMLPLGRIAEALLHDPAPALGSR